MNQAMQQLHRELCVQAAGNSMMLVDRPASRVQTCEHDLDKETVSLLVHFRDFPTLGRYREISVALDDPMLYCSAHLLYDMAYPYQTPQDPVYGPRLLDMFLSKGFKKCLLASMARKSDFALLNQHIKWLSHCERAICLNENNSDQMRQWILSKPLETGYDYISMHELNLNPGVADWLMEHGCTPGCFSFEQLMRLKLERASLTRRMIDKLIKALRTTLDFDYEEQVLLAKCETYILEHNREEVVSLWAQVRDPSVLVDEYSDWDTSAFSLFFSLLSPAQLAEVNTKSFKVASENTATFLYNRGCVNVGLSDRYDNILWKFQHGLADPIGGALFMSMPITMLDSLWKAGFQFDSNIHCNANGIVLAANVVWFRQRDLLPLGFTSPFDCILHHEKNYLLSHGFTIENSTYDFDGSGIDSYVLSTL